METDTKSASVLKAAKEYFHENDIDMENTWSLTCTTDGVRAIIGKHRRFIGFIKERICNITTIHCVLHRQYEVA